MDFDTERFASTNRTNRTAESDKDRYRYHFNEYFEVGTIHGFVQLLHSSWDRRDLLYERDKRNGDNDKSSDGKTISAVGCVERETWLISGVQQ